MLGDLYYHLRNAVMILSTNVFLLLLPITSFASHIPSFNQVNLTHRRTGCLDPYDRNRKVIVFSAVGEGEGDFKYAIDTRYHNYYPKALENALRLSNFYIDWLPEDEHCGWWKAKTVHHSQGFKLGGNHGDVYWKYSDLRWQKNTKRSHSAAHWIATTDSHIPPHKDRLPNNETLDMISEVLQDNEPVADVFEITTICLGYICGLLTFTLLVLLVKQYALAEDQTKPKVLESSDDIELCAIKVQNTSTIASATRANMPAEMSKTLHTGAPQATLLFTGSSHSEPLPPYSAHGSGR